MLVEGIVSLPGINMWRRSRRRRKRTSKTRRRKAEGRKAHVFGAFNPEPCFGFDERGFGFDGGF